MTFPPGRYQGRILDYGVYKADYGQQHYTAYIRFMVVGRYHPEGGELVDCPTEAREFSRAITPNTYGWLLADLKSIGYDRDGFEDFDPESPGAVDLFDLTIDVSCRSETYKNAERERWSITRGGPRTKVGRDALAELDASLGSRREAATVGPTVSQCNSAASEGGLTS
jgi:hypothetical protein